MSQNNQQPKNQNNIKSIIYTLLFYHPDFWVHLLISLAVYLISTTTAVGVYVSIFPKAINFTIFSIILGVLVYTFLFNFLMLFLIQIFTYKNLQIILSFRFIFTLFCIFMMTVSTNNGFSFHTFGDMLLYTLIYSVTVFFVSLAYRRLFLKKIMLKRSIKNEN